MENIGGATENIEYATHGMIDGQIKGTNDLFMRKTYYQVSSPDQEGNNVGTCEKKQ